MSAIRAMAVIALVAFFLGVIVVGDAPAGEKGRVVNRETYFASSIPSVKVPDVDGHALYLYDAKGISFNEKWGVAVIASGGMLDYIKGTGSNQGYSHFTFEDGSTITASWKGESKGETAPGTAGRREASGNWTYIKGTGRFEGIQGGGTWKSHILGSGLWYSDTVGEYALP